jgi:hypothetical protein
LPRSRMAILLRNPRYACFTLALGRQAEKGILARFVRAHNGEPDVAAEFSTASRVGCHRSKGVIHDHSVGAQSKIIVAYSHPILCFAVLQSRIGAAGSRFTKKFRPSPPPFLIVLVKSHRSIGASVIAITRLSADTNTTFQRPSARLHKALFRHAVMRDGCVKAALKR